MKNQDSSVKKLNASVNRMVDQSGGRTSPLLEKQSEMNELLRNVQILTRDKQNQLHETLKEVGEY